MPDRRTKPDEKMLRMATQLVDSLTTDWHPESYHDTYTEELRSRIEAKEKGEEITAEPETEQKHEVVDLMQALEDSVKKAKTGRRKASKSSKARKSA